MQQLLPYLGVQKLVFSLEISLFFLTSDMINELYLI